MRNIFYNRYYTIIVLLLIYMGPFSAFMRGGIGGVINWFSGTLLMLPGIIVGISFHEFAHAKAAQLCGDDTPVYQGRVTLDPKAHIDPIGLIYLIFIHFGWGRPVQINPSNFKNRRRDSIIVGLAGVTMNFLVALVIGMGITAIYKFMPSFFSSSVGLTVGNILMEAVVINISLLLFNLLPVPPLDGFGVIVDVFKLWGTNFYRFVFANSSIILIALILLDIPGMLLSGPLYRIVNFIMSGICRFPYWYALL